MKKHLEKIKFAILQDKAIEKCVYCQPIKKEIEAHHSNVKSVPQAAKYLLTCKECRIRIADIVNCAKRGHIIP